MAVNTAIFNDKVSMTSVEIAELVGSQHGNVRISIERLAKRGVIQLPAMQ
ncbi:DNA-binding protein, partial [Shigella boydii]